MLLLDRDIGEEILIGDDSGRTPPVIVTVVSVLSPGRVKLGIVAPPSVLVDRREVREARASGGRLTAGEIREALRAERRRERQRQRNGNGNGDRS